jgi:thioredoxin 1
MTGQVGTKAWHGLLLILLILGLSGCADRESKEQSAHPYDEHADAAQDISTALAGLGGQKRLLLLFGANWCPNCRRLDATLKQPEISGYLNGNFTLVKVDVGNFDKNLDLFKRYGLQKKNGIPSLVIVDGSGAVVRTAKSIEVAKNHAQGREAFYAWFKTL